MSNKFTELCDCCDGTGLCTDIYGQKGACMTCNGRGYFIYSEKPCDHPNGDSDTIVPTPGANKERPS
ncbi:MAG: hypothetical protein RPT95_13635 [Candidatus Sedimenticola sp. (ex Thyasira tokunagai)]